jgi:hypothetical protein
MKKHTALALAIAALLILIASYVSSAPKSDLAEQDAIKKADMTSDVSFLNDLVKSQNRFASCINEVAAAYASTTGKVMPPAYLANARQCLVTIKKTVSSAGNGVYTVDYAQSLPETCKSARTLSDLLKVQVDTGSSTVKPEWQSGIVLDQKTIDNTEASLKPLDCKGYAEFVTTHGSIH